MRPFSFGSASCHFQTPLPDQAQFFANLGADFQRPFEVHLRVRGHRAHSNPLLASWNAGRHHTIRVQSIIKKIRLCQQHDDGLACVSSRRTPCRDLLGVAGAIFRPLSEAKTVKMARPPHNLGLHSRNSVVDELYWPVILKALEGNLRN